MSSQPDDINPHAPVSRFLELARDAYERFAAHFDAIDHAMCNRLAPDFAIHGIITTMGDVSAGNGAPDPTDLIPDAIDVWQDIDDVARRVAQVAVRPDPSHPSHPSMKRAIAILTRKRRDRGRTVDFIDTDEIPSFVAAAFGLGVLVQRDQPAVARAWLGEYQGNLPSWDGGQ